MGFRIAHFFPDDKFCKYAINMFDSIEMCKSDYYIVSSSDNYKFIDTSLVKTIKPDELKKYIENSDFCDVLILHSLYTIPISNINKINNKIIVIWFSWGFDIYDNIFPEYPLINLSNKIIELDESLYSRIKKYWRLLKQKRREFIYYNRYGGKQKRAIFEQAIKRVDYYSGVFPEEYNYLIKKHCFRAKPFCFNYVGNTGAFAENVSCENAIHVGNDIQVGHNGQPFLNHIDVFRRLSKILIGNRKIICPLSYCLEKEYGEMVLKEGENLLGNMFVPIMDFMPFDEYNKLLSNIGYLILNVKRQCGVTNVLIGIWNGAKVFFPKKSMNYNHFKKMGVRVYSIEEELNEHELNTKMTYEEVIKNRRIINDYYRWDKVRQRLIDSLNSISLRK